MTNKEVSDQKISGDLYERSLASAEINQHTIGGEDSRGLCNHA